MKLRTLLSICEDDQAITVDIDDAVVSGIVEDVLALIDDGFLDAEVSFVRTEDDTLNVFARCKNDAE